MTPNDASAPPSSSAPTAEEMLNLLCEPCRAAFKTQGAPATICDPCGEKLLAAGFNTSTEGAGEASFEDQLAGIVDYLKHATLAAMAAIAEGHPEQVLDLIGNLITSFEKIRTFEPIVKLQTRWEHKASEAKKKDKEALDDAWLHAEREREFMAEAVKKGLTEDTAFAILERTFPPAPAPAEGEAQPKSPLAAALEAISQMALQYTVQAAAEKAGGGGGGGEKKPCTTCQDKMKNALQELDLDLSELDETIRRTSPRVVEQPGIRPHAPASIEDQLSRYGKDVGSLSQMATVASMFGAPSVPVGGAQVLEQLGVHTGSRVHSTYQTAGLDPRMVEAPPPVFGGWPPSNLASGAAHAASDPGRLAAYRYGGPPIPSAPSIAITLDELVNLDVLKPTIEGNKLTFEMGPNAPSAFIAAVLEAADRAALQARIEKTQRERGPQFSADGADAVSLIDEATAQKIQKAFDERDVQAALADNH